MKTQTILIVEDEEDIREVLAFNLAREGFSVLEAGTGTAALELARRRPDLILLDLMLPEMDGLSVCRALQRDPGTAAIPVIMLTAKGEEIDRIVGLELGAIDYVVKPFSLREVILRIRSALRRGRPAEAEASRLERGPLLLELGSRRASLYGVSLDLTNTEYRILEDLMRHAGMVRSREQLLDQAWDYSFEGYARTVDSHVKRLRSKLRAAWEKARLEGSAGPDDISDPLETVRGVGYRLTE